MLPLKLAVTALRTRMDSRPPRNTRIGESIKTAQSLLGHSDLGTTLNTYAHVIPASQRRAVERVAGVLFSDVLKLDDSAKDGRVN
jgi:integrase